MGEVGRHRGFIATAVVGVATGGDVSWIIAPTSELGSFH